MASLIDKLQELREEEKNTHKAQWHVKNHKPNK